MGFEDLVVMRCADKNKQAQQFARLNHTAVIECMFDTVADIAADKVCLHHKGRKSSCKLTARPNFCTAGPPCQPYTSLRDHGTLPAEEHGDYNTLWIEFCLYIRHVRPLSGCVEEVMDFDSCQGGRSKDETFMRQLEGFLIEEGYCVCIMVLDNMTWRGLPRKRCKLCVSCCVFVICMFAVLDVRYLVDIRVWVFFDAVDNGGLPGIQWMERFVKAGVHVVLHECQCSVL